MKLAGGETPAGFGRTTLAWQWLDKNSVPSAWLCLDRGYSDQEDFLREGGGHRCLLDSPPADPGGAYASLISSIYYNNLKGWEHTLDF